MNVSLTPELEALVNEKVRSGLYHTASEVIREALRLLKERDEARQRKLEDLRRDLQVGIEQLERGESFAYDERSIKDLAKDVKRRGTLRIREQRKTGTR